MTREDIFAMFGWRCAFDGCAEMATEIHHAGKHNTNANRKRWPLFVDSPFNKKPVCKTTHTLHPNFGAISDMQADIFEKYLRELKEGK